MKGFEKQQIHAKLATDCGWGKATHVSYSGNVSGAFSPENEVIYMYAGVNGWIISNRILDDLSADPGPGVIFASSHNNPTNPSALDYCDGARIVAANASTLSENTTPTIRLSYKSERG